MTVSVLTACFDANASGAARERLERLVREIGPDGERYGGQCGRSVVVACGPRSSGREDERFAAAWIRGPRRGEKVSRRDIRSDTAGASAIACEDGLELRRGPFGGHALFYAQLPNGGLLACSQLAPLVAAVEARTLNRDVFATLILADTARDPSATIYRDIRRVRPCEVLRFGGSTVRSSFEIPRAPELRTDPPDALAEELVAMLAEAIGRATQDARSVAVSAGGGLDSSGLLATLVRGPRANPSTRCAAVAFDFEGPGDDRPHLAGLERFLGVNVLRFRPADAGGVARSQFAPGHGLYTWPTGAMERHAALEARSWGADVLLTGNAGDLILDGPPGSLATRAGEGDAGALLDAALLLEGFRSTPLNRMNRLIVKPILRRLVPDFILQPRRRYLSRRALRRSATWAWAGPYLRDVLESDPKPGESDEGYSSWATAPWFADAADSRNHVEVGFDRVDPYLDPAFVRFMASVPPAHVLYGRRSRGLFRHAMRGLMPESVRLRSDKASFEPAIDQIVAALGGLSAFDSLLTMEATADLGLIEPRAFRRAFEAQARGVTAPNGWLDVWPAVAVEAFVRGVGLGAPEAS